MDKHLLIAREDTAEKMREKSRAGWLAMDEFRANAQKNRRAKVGIKKTMNAFITMLAL